MAEPHAFTAPLTVAIDVKSPQSYLAKVPTYALADELHIEIDWLPIIAPPLSRPPTGDDRGSRHRRFRAAYRERDLERYAGARGLTLKNVYRAPDSSLAGMGLLAAKARSERAVRSYLDAMFDAYWTEAIDIEDESAIAAVLEACGVHTFEIDRAGFEALQDRLRAAGFFDAPAYMVEGELFFGRAHLPMIRWILEGRPDPVPI